MPPTPASGWPDRLHVINTSASAEAIALLAGAVYVFRTQKPITQLTHEVIDSYKHGLTIVGSVLGGLCVHLILEGIHAHVRQR